MAESTTIATLRHKRDEIARSIVAYEKRLAQARADLAHINATITIFSASGERQVLPPYVDVHRLFARGEAMTLCKAALASGPMNTRQLALHVMKAKGLDTGDRVLAKAVASRLIHALRQQARRGTLDGTERVRGVRVWRLHFFGGPLLKIGSQCLSNYLGLCPEISPAEVR